MPPSAPKAGGHGTYDYITFLSDYGLQDEFVAVCKGVMHRIAPGIAIVDISHQLEPFALRRASLVLAAAVRYMPIAVHLAIVDPTVGSKRRAVVIGCRDGSVFVGPDNGLLNAAVQVCGGADGAWELSNPGLQLPEVSRTFHGRDIFAPAAAHVATGRALHEFGEAIPLDALVELPAPLLLEHAGHVHCEAIATDRFGNVQLSVGAEQLARALSLTPESKLDVWLGDRRLQARWAGHFSAVPVGAAVVIGDSAGQAALAVNQGSFAGSTGVRTGDEVVLGRAGFDLKDCPSRR